MYVPEPTAGHGQHGEAEVAGEVDEELVGTGAGDRLQPVMMRITGRDR